MAAARHGLGVWLVDDLGDVMEQLRRPRARKRLWTLRDLDRDTVWRLYWNPRENRWDIEPLAKPLSAAP